MKKFYIAMAFCLAGCNQEHPMQDAKNVNEFLPDFLDIKAGEAFDLPGTKPIDNGSRLPYAWVLAPLPKDTVVSPSINYRLNIDKKSLVVQSVTITEAQPSQSCNERVQELTKLLLANGFVASTNTHSSATHLDSPHIKGNQVAAFSCSLVWGLPFSEMKLQISTDEEHEKFERRMRNIGS